MAKKGSRKSAAARRKRARAIRKTKTVQQPEKVDFATEYHYVLSDLKRFAILALAMFATLIVLALVLG